MLKPERITVIIGGAYKKKSEGPKYRYSRICDERFFVNHHLNAMERAKSGENIRFRFIIYI